jgi:hypothetical protein
MSRATEYLFQRGVVGFERLDGTAIELSLICGHSVVHVPTHGDLPLEAYCKKCMQASERGLDQLTEALCR